ncbi:MAG: RDD family protein [Bacteroidota bacterium]
MEVFNNGQSVGKMAMKIQVIKTIGGQATFADYAARWAFRMIDIWFSLGGIAAILVASSAKAQRIGDVVANTAVIKLIPKMNLRLNDLLAIKSQESYKPSYIQVKQLQETDVLLIKATLERNRQFKILLTRKRSDNSQKRSAPFLISCLPLSPTCSFCKQCLTIMSF